MSVPGEAKTRAIFLKYAVPVQFTGAGLTAGEIKAVKRDEAAGDPLLGGGSSLRKITFEVMEQDLAGAPENDDTLAELDAEGGSPIAGRTWAVIEVVPRSDIFGFELIVQGTGS